MNIQPPVRPPNPVLESTDLPDLAHVWDREWESGYHQGYVCTVCEEMSNCELCDKDALTGVDCLREQADNRNIAREFDHKKAMERYNAQMDYYRSIAAD